MHVELRRRSYKGTDSEMSASIFDVSMPDVATVATVVDVLEISASISASRYFEIGGAPGDDA